LCNNRTVPSFRVVSLSFFLRHMHKSYICSFQKFSLGFFFFLPLLSFFFILFFFSSFNFVCCSCEKKSLYHCGTLTHLCWSPLKRMQRINSGSLRFFFFFFLSLPLRSLPKIAINKIMRSCIRFDLESCTVLRARPTVLYFLLSMFRNRSVIEQYKYICTCLIWQ
jgi:hypothetical protein